MTLAIPYVYTFVGYAALMFCRHLITIDDDFSNGFSNPELSKSIWHNSLAQLAIKFGLLIILCALIPSLKIYGA